MKMLFSYRMNIIPRKNWIETNITEIMSSMISKADDI